MNKLHAHQQELVNKRLNQDNTWWATQGIPSDYASMQHRHYIEQFYPMVQDCSVRRAIILMGPRRVGKTVMIFHCIEKLIRDGIDPQKIVYISIDTPIYSNYTLEDLVELSTQALKAGGDISGYYIFFDEIQYLKDWEVHLKSLVDTYRQSKFIASGSAAAALKMKSKESGAGRFSDFILPPLTFLEYIAFTEAQSLLKPAAELKDWACLDIDALNAHFINYINYGGYPEVVFSQSIQNSPGQYIRNDIVDKVLLRDLPSLYGISDIQELNRLFMYIAFHSSREFSYEGISRDSGLSKETIKKYLQYLEAAFLIKILHRVDSQAKRMKRITSFKIYLSTTSLYCALYAPIASTNEQIGAMVETALVAQELQKGELEFYYSSWKSGREHGEVDLIQVQSSSQRVERCTEMKWSDRYFNSTGELKSLAKFLRDNPQCQATVTSISKQGLRLTEQGEVLFVPAAIYAYWASYTAYEQFKNRMADGGVSK